MPTVYNQSISYPSPAPAQTIIVTMNGRGVGFIGDCTDWYGYSYFDTSAGQTAHVDESHQDAFNFQDSITMQADTAVYWQAYCKVTASGFCGTPSVGGGYLYPTLPAMLASASAPASSNVLSYTATISCLYFPNTNQSTASVKLQYRKQGDSVWIDAPGGADVVSGYNQLSISRNLTGLLALTTYEFRLVITRTTVNDQNLTSSISTFTTQAGYPSIQTLPATSIAPTQATLNGIVKPNGISTTYYFKWGTVKGGPYPNTTAVQGPSSGLNPIGFSALITGLSPGQVYFFEAVATV